MDSADDDVEVTVELCRVLELADVDVWLVKRLVDETKAPELVGDDELDCVESEAC